MGHTSFHLDRRQFLQAGALAGGALLLGPAHLKRAFATGPIKIGDGPYGPLGPFNADGIALPAGFTSREIARGASPVAGSNPSYTWHNATDGQATFATLGSNGAPDGGWILVANSEMPVPEAGGVSAVEFAADGKVERAYRILGGTMSNCAGGPTPWGRWLSCEEHDGGLVWECDPTGAEQAVSRPALGTFSHEAACVDPVAERLYLTEDEGDGCWYRFTPADYPDLSAGLLECAVVAANGKVSWVAVPQPNGGSENPTRGQVPEATKFDGGEGTWFDNGIVYFTTKGDQKVWAYDTGSLLLETIYHEEAVGPDAPLSGVDNITVSRSGDIYVCEDGRDHDICLITPDFEIARFLKLDPVIHSGPSQPNPVAGNETVGVVFSPDGDRMYFGAQRSFGVAGVSALPAGVVYEVTGPFRRARAGAGGGGGEPKVRARRRRRINRFLRNGLSVKVEVGEPVGVKATLEVADGGGRRRQVTIGRGRATVAVQGKAAVRVRPTADAERTLEGRDRAVASLRVTVTDGAGNRQVLKRRVVLSRGD